MLDSLDSQISVATVQNSTGIYDVEVTVAFSGQAKGLQDAESMREKLERMLRGMTSHIPVRIVTMQSNVLEPEEDDRN